MLRRMLLAAVAVLWVGSGHAQTPPPPKADCSKFKKMTDGRWTSTITAKVGNPKSFVVLKPGIPIERNLTVVGLNVSDEIDQLCGSK